MKSAVVGHVPQGHWKTITFVAALRQHGMTVPQTIDGSMTGEKFLTYVEQYLAPTLKRKDIVMIDNLPAHKAAGVREAIEARRKASLPAQMFARPESDRAVFQQAQGRRAQGSRTDNSASAPPDRPLRAHTDLARSVKLFQPCRLCVKSTGICLVVRLCASLAV